MGWLIIKHSFGLVFRNFGQALRVSVGPILLAALIIYLVAVTIGMTPARIFMTLAVGRMMSSLILFGLFVLAVISVMAAWIAVAWHRFILLEEYPGLLPAASAQLIGWYVGKTLMLSAILFLASFAFGLVAGFLTAILGLQDNFLAGFAFGLLNFFVMIVVYFRLALILPATAVGSSMTLAASRAATAPMTNDILGAAGILIALSAVANLVTGLFPIFSLPFLALTLVTAWVFMLVGMSVLTTLYGYLIEKRPLV
jgi:hypothetical protein